MSDSTRVHKTEYADARSARLAMRSGEWSGPTEGRMPGYVQCGLVVLPREYAYDFLVYCIRNPKACPVLDVTDAGCFEPQQVARGADLRTDLPLYRVYRHNEEVFDTADATPYWPNDSVAFLIGSSLTFEEPMRRAGIQPSAHVWVLATTLHTQAAGPFTGQLIVTMRLLSPSDAIKAVQVSARFPHNHGTPVHIGDPTIIGADLLQPLVGPPVLDIPTGLVPVFWACSVTTQAAVRNAQPRWAITHSPAHGFITDLLADQFGM